MYPSVSFSNRNQSSHLVSRVSIVTLTLSILQTSPDQFCVFKVGSVLPILRSIVPFCIVT